MFAYTEAHSPVRINESEIQLKVKSVHLDSEITFSALEGDLDSTGRELYTRAANGEFGEVTVKQDTVALEALSQVWDKIQVVRERKTQQGGCKVGNYWFHSDTHSKLQQMALMLVGQALPPNLEWKTMDGS